MKTDLESFCHLLRSCCPADPSKPARKRKSQARTSHGEPLESREMLSGTAVPAETTASPPQVVNPIEDQFVNEGTSQIVIDLSTVFEGNSLEYFVQRNTNSSLIHASIEGTQLTLTFVDPNYLVAGDFTIRAVDSNGDYADARFYVEMIPFENTPPTIVRPFDEINVDEDSDSVVIDLASYFADAEDVELSILVQTNSNETLVTATMNGSELQLDFGEHQYGTAQLTIRAVDTSGDYVEQTLDITVNSVNDVPVVQSEIEDIVVDANSPQTVIDLADVFSDIEDTDLNLIVQSLSQPGIVEASLDGTLLTLTYLPDQVGEVEITIRATDSDGASVDHSFFVTVNSVNTPPTVVNPISNLAVEEGVEGTEIDLSDVFSDAESQDLLLTISGNSNAGLVTVQVIGSELVLEFAEGQTGSAEITIRAMDADGLFVEETFLVTVTATTGGNEEPRKCHRNKGWNHVRRGDCRDSRGSWNSGHQRGKGHGYGQNYGHGNGHFQKAMKTVQQMYSRLSYCRR